MNEAELRKAIKKCFVDTEMESVDEELTLFDTDATIDSLLDLYRENERVVEAKGYKKGRASVGLNYSHNDYDLLMESTLAMLSNTHKTGEE